MKEKDPYQDAIKNQEAPMSDKKCMELEFGRKAKKGYHLTRNLMSGKVIEIADGTPLCCDPSSETYWSM